MYSVPVAAAASAAAGGRVVIDLLGNSSPPPPAAAIGVAAARASAAASSKRGGGGVIELLDDSSDDDNNNIRILKKPPPPASSSSSSAAAATAAGRRRRKRQRQQGRLKTEGLDNDDDEEVQLVVIGQGNDDEQKQPALQPPAPIVSVLQVIPDVDVNYAKQLLHTHDNNLEVVVTTILEQSNNYPKSKITTAVGENNNGIGGGGDSGVGFAAAGGGGGGSSPTNNSNNYNWKYDYMLQSSFEPSKVYKEQAPLQLMRDFPFLKKPGAQRILEKAGNWHYAVAHDKILTAVKGTTTTTTTKATSPKRQSDQKRKKKQKQNDDYDFGKDDVEVSQYNRVRSALACQRLDRNQIRDIDKLANTGRGNNRSSSQSSCVLKQPRSSGNSPCPLITADSILHEEVRYVSIKLNDWLSEISKRIQRLKNQRMCQQLGTGTECSCCYDNYDINDMVACRDEGHIFCVDCLKSYTEGQVFGNGNLGIDKSTKQPALELKCFHGGNDGNGCTSGFHRSCIDKALPSKTLRKYDEVQFQISVERAGLNDDLCSCPKCGFQASLPPSMKVFHCPVTTCRYESCRYCEKASHIPLRCEEVVKEAAETKGRLTVEEAITKAKIRKCPKCSKPFVKSDGCNKIRCGCGIFVCYVCQQQIKGYEHFCQTPHCNHKSCNKCRLWTKDEEDDARAMKEAGLKAAENQDVQIDVDNILKDPTAKAAGRKNK